MSFNGIPLENYVDLNQYQGTWYQIAKYPVPYEPDDAFNTTAIYTLNNDNTISVRNESHIIEDGKIKMLSITGKAVSLNANNNVLSVTFVQNMPQVPNYLIMYIGSGYDKQANQALGNLNQTRYKYALVSSPNKESLYILSRYKIISKRRLQYFLSILTNYGFDVNKLILTPQVS